MAIAYVALGSNLGDRAEHLRYARRLIGELPGTRLTGCSRVYETEPVGPVDQGPFLNAAVELATTLEPMDLLNELQAIENRCGRVRKERWGPRTMDLDLLLYDQLAMKTERLTLPHPHMHERAFVLQPMCDIAPGITLPQLDITLAELLSGLPKSGIDPVAITDW